MRRREAGFHRPPARRGPPPGLFYEPDFISRDAERRILDWLKAIRPIWEHRFSRHRPIPSGESQRLLLRPVYWLGSWQFACLNYYHPPGGTWNRCVRAEPFPPVLQDLVRTIEKMARQRFRGDSLPADWHLNTCLVNLYGSRREGDRSVDVARVGEHKDFEPGPVASLSLGERALFQFVRSRGRHQGGVVVYQQWLEHGSLQLFGGETCKRQLFHRVQRVEKKLGTRYMPQVADYETRRLNFTFRYVPDAHIVDYRALPADLRGDVREYMTALAQHSDFFRAALGESEG
jgi:alkylated DNA repair dioxygenase AlkB